MLSKTFNKEMLMNFREKSRFKIDNLEADVFDKKMKIRKGDNHVF